MEEECRINNYLYNEIVYRPKIPYSINTFIYEYDISKANITALLDQGYISKERYNELYYADRQTRQIAIGIMIRDNHDIGTAIKNGIKKAKMALFTANDINDWEVLTIKNDAVFILGRKLLNTEFGLYKFVCKNMYTVFLQLDDLEVYYYDQFINGDLSINIDIKGINDNNLPSHENGMLRFICDICSRLQRQSVQDTLSFAINFYNDYVNYRLPVEYYREFNSKSKYAIRSSFSIFYTDLLDQKDIYSVDINRNLSIIRCVIQVISSLYK